MGTQVRLAAVFAGLRARNRFLARAKRGGRSKFESALAQVPDFEPSRVERGLELLEKANGARHGKS